MQTDETENVVAKHYRYDEQRTCSKTFREKPDALVITDSRNVVEPNRLSDIDVLGKLFEIEWNNSSQTRRHITRRAPLVADAKLAGGLQLDHVAAIDVHHAAEFGNDYGQEPVEVDCVRENHREAVDNPLASLVHLDLAF